METFIQETMLEDTSICDQLIEYHKNNLEYKNRKTTGNNIKIKGKVSTDVTVFIGNQNPIIHMYLQEVMKQFIHMLKHMLNDLGFSVTLREHYLIYNIMHQMKGFLVGIAKEVKHKLTKEISFYDIFK